MDEPIARHYDLYPYPTPGTLTAPAPRRHVRDRISFLLRRRPATWIRPDIDVWVAGCGTQQAATWALCFPEARVLATDVSAATLDRARTLVASLGCHNVEFAQRDLAAGDERAGFDFVVCTGVVHHLPDPAAGVRALRRALRPGGAGLFMVYSTQHRAPLAGIRATLDALGAGTLDDAARYALTRRVLEAAVSSPHCAPPGKEALRLLFEHVDADPSFVADALLNPRESTYDLDGLFSLLEGNGLSHRSWNQPRLWDLEAWVDDAGLRAAFAERTERDRDRIVHHLAGFASPQFECLVEPADAPPAPVYELDELLDLPFGLRAGRDTWRIQGTGFVPGPPLPTYRLHEDTIEIPAPGGWGPSAAARVPAALLPVLEAMDGTRTLRDILDGPGAGFDRDSVLRFAAELLPPALDAAAPRP